MSDRMLDQMVEALTPHQEKPQNDEDRAAIIAAFEAWATKEELEDLAESHFNISR